ncbi:MAG: SDR family oxidoreductase [Gemmatimonadota bacterium]|nr:MAG: SDR family oxidoreductase [Gemmatimonadota bacterium]
MTEFAAKNVVITGAANGIGRLLAEKLAGQSAHVILWDVDGARLKELTERLRKRGARVTSYQCDVTKRAAVYATAQRVLEKHGSVEILINNAGVVTGKVLLEMSDEEIEQTFQVNTLAHFWTTRAFLPKMLERNRGHIVTIASAAGLVGAPHLTDYSAAKFAAVGFDESLRLELKHMGADVKTTLVCPYYVGTGMFAGATTRFPWLLPILEPEYVANRIIEAIRWNRERMIMPRFVFLVPLFRLLPVRWFDALARFFGVTRGMDGFSGRSALRTPIETRSIVAGESEVVDRSQ